MRIATAVSIMAVILTTGTALSGGSPVTVAIIVNKNNPTSTLSARMLKQIFAGEKTRWPDGQKIGILAPSPDAAEHEPAIHFLFGMSEPEYRKYCIQATFTGNTNTVPREYPSSKAVINLVEIIPGAIAFVRADAVNPKVKVIRIDDRAPGDDGYPLSSAK
jgi:ABC-type phosphate transport system substrate-binding protein